MLPNITLRIENLIKAMETIVIPAVDPDNDLATEQAQLIIGHLKLLNTQWDMAYLYELQALEEALLLGRELLAVADGGPETQAAKCALEAEINAVPEQKPHTSAALNISVVAVGTAIDTLIYACHNDGSENFKQCLASLVLATGEKQVMRDRVWFQATGLDPDPASLSSIEAMLNSSR
ncbi:MAG: hypothetical protein H6999_12770 [Hahellaceae bacterium]|nr:hypothetical protein [Hahellaceae bacterium]